MKFAEKLNAYEKRFKEYSFDYYNGATIISRLIYRDKIYDRYFAILEEFSKSKAVLYQDSHIAKLLKGNKDKRCLAVNIYRSRALSLLAIADNMSRLNISDGFSSQQRHAYKELQSLKNEIINYANANLRLSNDLATKLDYEQYEAIRL